jgi:RHS repeat-associated protein
LWWRGNPTILTTYGYNNAGDLQTVTYNDGTPSVTYGYDRRVRQTTVACNGMTTTLTYNDAGQLLTESYSGGTLNGLTVTSGYYSYLRRTSLSVNTQPSNINHSFTYDNASRLQTVSDGTHSATYSYLANSPLVDQISFKQNTTVRLTTTKQYDNLNRLRVISSVPSGSSTVSFTYQYNDANQRTRNTEANGDYWSYQYDTLGQVSSGKKYTSGGTPISGRQFEYDFDDIANRDYTVADGTTTDYTANLLNQYTSRVTGGTTETFQHDEDGNLQSDSLWIYTWDGENRLVKLESQTSVPDASKRKLQFEYDYRGRRIGKKVYLWSGGGYSATPSVSLKFVYDDWNLLAELDANNNLVRSYMWGLDLSGSEQGAGGVGGLLLFSDHSSPATRHFVAYEGNGNVMALVNAANGTISAQYEYSPFGETMSTTGIAASSNPFRFSTKYLDSESGFLYYGYRYYNPSTGRWLNRDPFWEAHWEENVLPIYGVHIYNELYLDYNLYGFLSNCSQQYYDYLGGAILCDCSFTFQKDIEVEKLDNGKKPGMMIGQLEKYMRTGINCNGGFIAGYSCFPCRKYTCNVEIDVISALGTYPKLKGKIIWKTKSWRIKKDCP